jgi:transcriptional regulator with XRE-family HTH domain
MTKQFPTRPTVAEFLADSIALINKTQSQIAAECGFDSPNVITMFKKGQTKLPINRVGPLAKALDVDPAHLLRLVLLEYLPDTWETIENTLQTTLLTANELEMVRAFREVTGDRDARACVIDRSAVVAIVTA